MGMDMKMNVSMETELRPCVFGGEVKGVFHGWISESQIVPGGIRQRILGLVETEKGEVYHIEPEYIRFIDNKVKRIFEEGCYDAQTPSECSDVQSRE